MSKLPIKSFGQKKVSKMCRIQRKTPDSLFRGSMLALLDKNGSSVRKYLFRDPWRNLYRIGSEIPVYPKILAIMSGENTFGS
jgi:hypothetical protein